MQSTGFCFLDVGGSSIGSESLLLGFVTCTLGFTSISQRRTLLQGPRVVLLPDWHSIMPVLSHKRVWTTLTIARFENSG